MNPSSDPSTSISPSLGDSSPSVVIIEAHASKKNAAMATNDQGNACPRSASDELRDAALQEAQCVLDATDAKEREADEAGWTLIQLMLKLKETFVRPKTGKLAEAAFEAFLAKHGAKQHGNTKNPMQRLAKVCFPHGARAERVSKYGAALAALTRRGITSDRVLEMLRESGPVPEGGGPIRTGIHRFMLLHREDMKLDKRSETPEDRPDNKYLSMPDAGLKAEALLIIEALREKGLLLVSTDEITEALST